MTENEILGIGLLVLAYFAYKRYNKKDDSGRIKDEYVDLENVISNIKSLKVKFNDKLKYGYTEQSVEKQLKTHLQKIYINLISQYSIGGPKGTRIDFDLGNGKIGVEIKVAKSLFKKTEEHRLMGQIDDYKKRYNNNNLLVVVFGEAEHTQERAHLSIIKNKIEEKSVHFLYVEM